MSNPSYLCSEPFDMSLLSFENILRDEEREGTILDAYTLDLLVEPLLYFFPNKERGGLANVSLHLLPSS